MTDKQIIIDGIDVGRCIYYEDGKCLNGEMVQCNCKKVAVCYYKEYKRKEQECKELKKEAVNLKLNLKKVINLSQKKNRQCYQFLADIKQLKHQHQADKGLITSTEKMNYQLLQEYDKLKTALTEIKEIIHFNKTNRLSGGADISIEQILQKISECEVMDE